MTASAPEHATPILDAYRRHPARAPFDEVVTSEGLREPSAALGRTIESLGRAGLLVARSEASRQVAADGISATDQWGQRRPWLIDPLPVPLPGSEWSAMEAALDQRARLLDLVLTDLYSQRRLLRSGLIPAGVVLAHPGFARVADGSLTGRGRKLRLTSTDLGRDATGRWLAISDRTQAPAGAAYAMATRRVVSKALSGLHRDSDLARLRSYFLAVTGALLAAAPSDTETPQVVIHSPGADSDYAFDQGFLATLLGFPLAEADDLVLSGGRVWLRAGPNLEPVDVILRRVDDSAADPLEYRSDSEIGLPGLIEATRRNTVAVANPIGSAILDNPALAPYLPAACRELLGEELQLASPRTWWAGTPSGAAQVLAELSRLVIKPVARGYAPVSYGWLLSSAERDALVRRIQAEPWAWCAQEPVELSTAPVVTGTGLEPRRFVLRSFGVATADSYQFLPGGLGRVAASVDDLTISSSTGALAKDVWIPAAAPRQATASPRPRLAVARANAVSPRVANTLMTIGRLAERAESTARLIKVADDLTEDFGSHGSSAGAEAVGALRRAVTGITGSVPRAGESTVAYLSRLTSDAAEPGSVHHSVQRLIADAHEVRDILSVDSWSVFDRLERTVSTDSFQGPGLQHQLADVLESLLAFAGIMTQSMVRDSSWAFLEAGGRLERAAHTVKLLRFALLSQAEDRLRPSAELAAEAVLRAGESIITHRRRAAAGTGPATGTESVRQLLIHDHANPRSVVHQLTALADALALVGDSRLAGQATAICAQVDAVADIAQGADQLAVLGQALAGLAERIAVRHFTRQATRHGVEATWVGSSR